MKLKSRKEVGKRCLHLGFGLSGQLKKALVVYHSGTS